MIVPGDVVRVDAARPRWWNLLGLWRWWRRPKVSGRYRVVSVTETTIKVQQ